MLSQSERLRRPICERFGEGRGFFQQALAWDHPGNGPPSLRFLGGDRPARHLQLQSARKTDLLAEPEKIPGIRDEPDLYKGSIEFGFGDAEPEIAGEGEAHARAGRGAVDRRDDRFWEAADA